MLPDWKIQKIQELLAANVTHQQIAATVGVSRSTIRSVSNGRRTIRNQGKYSDAKKVEYGNPVIKLCEECGKVGYHYDRLSDRCIVCETRKRDNAALRRQRLLQDQRNTANLDLQLREQEEVRIQQVPYLDSSDER